MHGEGAIQDGLVWFEAIEGGGRLDTIEILESHSKNEQSTPPPKIAGMVFVQNQEPDATSKSQSPAHSDHPHFGLARYLPYQQGLDPVNSSWDQGERCT